MPVAAHFYPYRRFFIRLLVLHICAYSCTLIFYALSQLLSYEGVLAVLRTLSQFFSPFNQFIFQFIGFQQPSLSEQAALTLFIICMLLAVVILFKGTASFLLPPSKVSKRLCAFYWGMSFVFASGLIALSIAPSLPIFVPWPKTTSGMHLMPYCMKINIAFALCFFLAFFAFKGFYFWSILPKPLPAYLAKPVKNMKSADSPALDTSPSLGFFIALTAEIIQLSGKLKRFPTPEELAEPLDLLKKAAALTSRETLYQQDMLILCRAVCALLQSGSIKKLSQYHAAAALYKKPHADTLSQIARELSQHLQASFPH